MSNITNSDYYIIIYAEAQRHLEDSESSKLGHFNAASRYNNLHKYYLGLPTTVASLILAWLVTQKDLPSSSCTTDFMYLLKIIIGLIVAVLSGIITFLNFNDTANQHRKAALRYQEIFRKCKNWKTDFPDDTELLKAKAVVSEYRDTMTKINQESPQIPKWAYNKAQKQKKEGNTSYKVDSKNVQTENV